MESDVDTLPDGQPFPEYVTLDMLIPEGFEMGAPVTAAGLDAFTVVGLGFDHPGIENVGNTPARTDTGKRINGRTRILTRFAIGSILRQYVPVLTSRRSFGTRSHQYFG